jgi:hypothetical protein
VAVAAAGRSRAGRGRSGGWGRDRPAMGVVEMGMAMLGLGLRLGRLGVRVRREVDEAELDMLRWRVSEPRLRLLGRLNGYVGGWGRIVGERLGVVRPRRQGVVLGLGLGLGFGLGLGLGLGRGRRGVRVEQRRRGERGLLGRVRILEYIRGGLRVLVLVLLVLLVLLEERGRGDGGSGEERGVVIHGEEGSAVRGGGI